MPNKALVDFMNSLTNSNLTLSQQQYILNDVAQILLYNSFGIFAVCLVAYVILRLAQKTNIKEK